ncbi:MAG TPA: tRNA uridine-5-carboxymethylaminomethyl(34) synthesis GTPase MnmE [Thermoanaerobaculia bacterium]|nr:tRNA uridine-5-carboxymethylaminomethyl(34) synthesis GTPase MnmE [Thermoanaerobaculia bacterium]
MRPPRASELDTIVALATPMARSAIAVARLSGTEAFAIVRRIAPGLPEMPAPRTAMLAELRDAKGKTFDRGLVTFFPAPASYTGENVAEISIHGNPVLARLLLASAEAAGARLAEPGEFSRRAFLNEKLSLIEAESVAELIEAPTETAARGALARLSGGGERAIEPVREALLTAHALWTAAIDFPEQAGEEDPAEIGRHLAAARGRLARLCRGAELAARIASGFRVAILGAPNAGKSTVFNRLVGYERAIVTPEAGTTRDTLEADVEIAGLPVRLVDTAGIRETESAIEAEGVLRATAEGREADLAIWLHDASVPWNDAARRGWGSLDSHIKALVFNKIDIAPPPFEPGSIGLSAISEDAATRLREEIGRRLSAEFPPEAAGESVSRRQRDLLSRARDAVARSEAALARRDPAEIAILGVEDALASLAELVGESTTEDVLDRIFAKFCIGK